ncbi:MAG: hypothetical protein OXI87_17895 [Albidovulum sp.]|nr:hypothetical protein [Albidovulum sp.]
MNAVKAFLVIAWIIYWRFGLAPVTFFVAFLINSKMCQFFEPSKHPENQNIVECGWEFRPH